MFPPVLILLSGFLCHVAIAGRTCPKPDELPFSTVVPLKQSYEPGEQIVFSCRPGYVSRGGIRRFTCPLTGMWPINTLKCMRKSASFHTFSAHSDPVHGGQMTDLVQLWVQKASRAAGRGTVGVGFMGGETADSQCCLLEARRRGQQKMSWLDVIVDSMDTNLSKLWETVVDRGAWLDAVRRVTKARVCPFAGILENGTVRYTTFEYPNTISFSCHTGFYLKGASSARCTEEGKWSPDIPVCAPITCPPPPIPKFANLSVYKPLAGNNSFYGSKAVFTCSPHHAMFGSDTITCTEHGNWTKLPECREVRCPFPSRPDNGFVNYPANPVLFYKDTATFGCHETYSLDGPEEVECSKFGNWSAQPSCKASCKLPVKKATVIYEGERVAIQNRFKNGMLHGQKVSFFCKNKEKKCSYTEDAQCIDGTIEIPKCFKEHSSLAFWKTDASDVKPC